MKSSEIYYQLKHTPSSKVVSVALDRIINRIDNHKHEESDLNKDILMKDLSIIKDATESLSFSDPIKYTYKDASEDLKKLGYQSIYTTKYLKLLIREDPETYLGVNAYKLYIESLNDPKVIHIMEKKKRDDGLMELNGILEKDAQYIIGKLLLTNPKERKK